MGSCSVSGSSDETMNNVEIDIVGTKMIGEGETEPPLAILMEVEPAS